MIADIFGNKEEREDSKPPVFPFKNDEGAKLSQPRSPTRKGSSTTDFSIKNLATSSCKTESECGTSFSIKNEMTAPDNEMRISSVSNGEKKETTSGDKHNDESQSTKKPKNVTPEEMEQRNEIFRSTYYYSNKNTNSSSKQHKHQPQHSPKRCCSLSPNSSSSSSSYHHSHDDRSFLRRKKTFKSPQTNRSPPHLHSPRTSYYPINHYRDSEYHLDVSEKCKQTHNIRESSLDRINHHMECNSNGLQETKSSIESHHDSTLRKHHVDLSPNYDRKRHHQLLNRQWSSRSHPYPSMSAMRPGAPRKFTGAVNGSSRMRTEEPDIGNYESDFFTKLPPKLHIVESQNETGVTLTWNVTSNCDSSLVKSYQLFARELFGHKVGTMKRIGIVDALPLPMSCNIDKLKYLIKYKFAVCAIDVYGRYGKMSNFTGKFELKRKEDEGEKGASQPNELDTATKKCDHEEESQLQISF